jgi:3-dehydroquinate dehydratase-1
MQNHPIKLNGKPLAGGRLPAICVPLVGRDADALAREAAAAAALGPDLLEWRVDFFAGIADTGQVLAAAARIREAAGGLPVLFTRRSQREGGQPIGLAEDQVVALYTAVCAARAVEAVDFEMANDAAHVQAVRQASRAVGVALFLSFHDFGATPAAQVLQDRFRQAARLDADVAKVAVMPRQPEDVLALLQATLAASRELAIPVVSMSMAQLGALTRLCGWVFGSALTFAVGQGASAPGQLPVAGLRDAIALLQSNPR